VPASGILCHGVLKSLSARCRQVSTQLDIVLNNRLHFLLGIPRSECPLTCWEWL